MNSKLIVFLCALFTIALFAKVEASSRFKRDAEAIIIWERDAEANPYYYYIHGSEEFSHTHELISHERGKETLKGAYAK
ncbi:hypothetical protein Glove_521g14 [Diversispora epigaea]|uniref:Uncharacterized protein n=1 Tax=Diversispora epigaea TaxID=1348612 RepID=A0A397GG44_9GLOM|nr:hypothetical protein Glove_521g14 [Diversispora epigaea]